MYVLPQAECAVYLASCQRKRDLIAEPGEAAGAGSCTWKQAGGACRDCSAAAGG